MFYSMWKKRKLAMIVQKRHAKRNNAKEKCIFYLSCPQLDAVMGPPPRKPGYIYIHPIHALLLIQDGLKAAKKAKDGQTWRKLKGHRTHVQTILNMLVVYRKMDRLTMKDFEGGEKRVQLNIDT